MAKDYWSKKKKRQILIDRAFTEDKDKTVPSKQ